MDRRAALTADEGEAWHELWAFVDGLSAEQMEVPGVIDEGWSIKDTLWHIGCWTAEAARQLERIHLGTYVDHDWRTDELNAEFLEQGRELDLPTVKAQLSAARQQMVHCWAALGEISPEAVEWFEESGPIHFREHLAQMRAHAAGIA